MNTRCNFEVLPDEIILCICRYLRSVDVLYSFSDLNTRLTRTIADYYHDLRLAGYPYRRFDHVVTHVIPQISSSVQTLLINGNWETMMSPKAFSVLFGSPISCMFPQVKHLILKWFTCERIGPFLDNLHGLSRLMKLEVQHLKDQAHPELLLKILAANHRQLAFVLIDEDSIGLEVPDAIGSNTYLNIEELKVNVTDRQMLSRLFGLVPNVTRLCVHVKEYSSTPAIPCLFKNLPIFAHVIDFELHTIDLFWTWEEIIDLLSAMPSMQTLTLELRTEDERLTRKENIIAALPAKLTQIHLFIRYYLDEDDDGDTVIKSCTADSSIKYLRHNLQGRILFFTVPCQLRSLILEASISKQMSLNWEHMQRIEELQIYGITAMTEVFLIVQSFCRLRALELHFKSKTEPLVTTPDTKIAQPSLRLLKRLEVYGICELYRLVSVAPNMSYLCLDYNVFKTLYNDKATCDILKQQINRLDISSWVGTELDDIQLIADIFSNLDHIVLVLQDSSICIDLLPLTLLRLWKNRKSPSFNVNGSPSDEAKNNLKQWLATNSHLSSEDSFSIEYRDGWFDLWM